MLQIIHEEEELQYIKQNYIIGDSVYFFCVNENQTKKGYILNIAYGYDSHGYFLYYIIYDEFELNKNIVSYENVFLIADILLFDFIDLKELEVEMDECYYPVKDLKDFSIIC